MSSIIGCFLISFSFYLTGEKLTCIAKDPYLDAKNHPTLDVITITPFYIKMSKNHQIFDEIYTLPKVHIWI